MMHGAYNVKLNEISHMKRIVRETKYIYGIQF